MVFVPSSVSAFVIIKLAGYITLSTAHSCLQSHVSDSKPVSILT